MKFKVYLYFLIFFCIGCEKDLENTDCNYEVKNLSSKIIGEDVDDFHNHILNIDMGSEICIITRNMIRIFPFDTSISPYELEVEIGGAVVNDYDTIVQLNNTFYRFFPTQRKFQFIYSPPYTIHDFCVTPNHGIGYIWGNLFVEKPKFNYFYFDDRKNVTLFEYSKLIHESSYMYYQTFLKNDSLNLFLNTNSISRTDVGTFYNIDLNNAKIIDTLKYSFKSSIRIIKAQNLENLLLRYENGTNSAIFSSFNLKNKIESNIFQLKNNAWYNSLYSYDDEYISVAYRAGTSKDTPTLQLLDWKNNITIIKIPTPDEYLFQLGEICHFRDEYVALSGTGQSKAILIDNTGCLKYNLNFRNVTKSFLCHDNKKIVTLNNAGEVELVQLHN